MNGVGFLIAAILLVAAGVSVTAAMARRRREAELSTVARDLGLRYASDDPFAILDRPFPLFSKGDGRGIEHVLYGSWRGHEVRAFDHWYYEESRNPQGHSSRSTSRFSCVLLPVDVVCSATTIDAEGPLTRLADHLALEDIQFESEEFNRTFDVRSEDPRFASALIDGPMMDWMLANASACSIQLSGMQVLCFTRQLPPGDVPSLLEMAVGFVERIPPVTRSLYPPEASG